MLLRQSNVKTQTTQWETGRQCLSLALRTVINTGISKNQADRQQKRRTPFAWEMLAEVQTRVAERFVYGRMSCIGLALPRLLSLRALESRAGCDGKVKVFNRLRPAHTFWDNLLGNSMETNCNGQTVNMFGLTRQECCHFVLQEQTFGENGEGPGARSRRRKEGAKSRRGTRPREGQPCPGRGEVD